MIKKIEKGYSFNKIIRYAGGFLWFLALYNIFLFYDDDSVILAIVFLISGTVMIFSKETLLIDYKEKTFTNQLNIIGLKYNKKSDLSKYKYSSIISRRFTSEETEIDHHIKFELVFLTPKHLGKLLISQFDEYSDALELGEEVAKYTGKSLIKYSPKRISKIDRR